MPKHKHLSFGPLNRAQFQELVDAPHGRARQYLFDPWGMVKDCMVSMVIERLELLRDPVADEEFIEVEANCLVADLLELMERYGVL